MTSFGTPLTLTHLYMNRLWKPLVARPSLIGIGLCNPSGQPRRFYRFGRRTTQSGYYIASNWFDQRLLESDDQLNKIVHGTQGIVYHENLVFDEEKERQKSTISRLEKIQIELEKPFPNGQDYVLMMNANISTPYDCSAHVHQILMERSALAVVNGTEYWDMHRPLTTSCQLKLLHFKHSDTMPVNYAFWRSCSMLLGGVIRQAFKDQFKVNIISQPMSDFKSGSFVCDATIDGLTEWNATSQELQSFTSLLWEAIEKAHRFERLEVSGDVARRLFAQNSPRLTHIENEIANGKDQFTVYRVNKHIELSQGPMIANTNQMGTMFLTAIHPLKTSTGAMFYRFQGIALPKQLNINSYTFSLLRDRAQKLNNVGLQ